MFEVPVEKMTLRVVETEHLCYLSVSVDTYSGDTLTLVKLDRKQMGAYLCIASNDVPPAVSKRITLNVNCKYTLHKHLGYVNNRH